MKRSLGALARALRQIWPDCGPEDLADVAWLTLHWRSGAVDPREKPNDSSGADHFGVVEMDAAPVSAADPLPAVPPVAMPKAELPPEPPVSETEGTNSDFELFLPGASGQKGSASQIVRLQKTGIISDQRSLGRALAPLRRRIPGRRSGLLDEAGTVRRIVDEGIWLPVIATERELWLDAVVIVDVSPSMGIWQETVDETLRALRLSSAFRDFQVWSLSPEAKSLRLFPGLQNRDRPVSSRNPGELVDPTGRRVVLVVSDFVASGWETPGMRDLMTQLGRRQPLVLCQVLPERLWPHSAFGSAVPLRLASRRPAAPNRELIRETEILEPRSGAEPAHFPVVELKQSSILGWAKLIRCSSEIWLSGLDWQEIRFAAHTDLPPAKKPSAQSLVERFWVVASPLARQLALRLAAAPVITLPILRIIRSEILSGADRSHEAEVFLGSLLERVGNQPLAEEVTYDFAPGVRGLLLDSLSPSEALRVIEGISGYVQEHLDRGFDIRMFLKDPAAKRGMLGPKQGPTARVAAEILLRLGGEVAAAVRRAMAETRKEWGAPEAGGKSAPAAEAPKAIRPTNAAQRTLLLGFGGTGAQILTAVKEQTVLKSGASPASVRFLLFDTIADWRPGKTMRIASGAGEETLARGTETSLDPGREYFFLGDHEPSLRQYVYELLAPRGHAERYPHLKVWLHTPWLRDNLERGQMEIHAGTAQQRQIGRFAMFQNAERIIGQISRELRDLERESHGAPVNIWIVVSSAGGTGAGCLLDAAHLTRIAAGGHRIVIAGLIVLPEVYQDKAGISEARAYSLFRELERFQLQDFADRDRYIFDGKLTASNVLYDERGQVRSLFPNKLFDNVFYVGSECRTDEGRTAFFTSVASAMDPFLDENAGPQLLEKSFNLDASASAFGAARLYVPKESLGEIFAWQQVEVYLKRASGYFEKDGNRRLMSGSAQDRRKEAERKIRALSPLFGKILELEGTDDTFRKFARALQAPKIVEEWYGTSAPQVISLELRPEEVADLKLTYIAPTYSWREKDPERVPAIERVTKTWREYRDSAKDLSLPKESAEASRDRFAAELHSVMKAFKDPELSVRSFEKGRRTLFTKLSEHLCAKVDRMVIETMERSTRFGNDEVEVEQGTALTRLHHELREMGAEDGPFRKVNRLVRLFIESLEGEEEQREQEAVQAIGELREWKSRIFGSSVEGLQVAARDSVSHYFSVYQRNRLLVDLQRLVREVESRVEAWEKEIRSAFDVLFTDPASSCRADTALQVKRLESRLARLARNPKARISADPDWSPERPGEDMLGYRQALAERCAVGPDGIPWVAAMLGKSRWLLDLDAKKRPTLGLEFELDPHKEKVEARDLTQVHRRLYRALRAPIDLELSSTDIFDYLLWVEGNKENLAKKISWVLNNAAEPLINFKPPSQEREICHLMVRRPVDKTKERWIQHIAESLRDIVGNAYLEIVPYSDPDSIGVLRLVKPRSLADFNSIDNCAKEYAKWQAMVPSGDEAQRKEVRRAQVYHVFRPELEAWFIERRARQLHAKFSDRHSFLVPRLVALLEDPAMMQAFVECVATGAVEKHKRGAWIWHSEDGDLALTSGNDDGDLIRAAVVFVLQKREGLPQGLRNIELAAARQSARIHAAARNLTVAEACADFYKDGLETLLEQIRPYTSETAERDREGLKMIFEFYGHPDTPTTLDHRLKLVWRA